MKLKTYAAAAALGAVGLLGAATVVPGIASAAPGGGAVSDRVTRIKDALAGLVKDGTLTQSQADRVAQTLHDRLPQPGPRRPGPRGHLALDAAAETLGITEAALLAQLRSGATLADVARSRGVAVAAVVDALVAAEKERLDAAVAAGRLTRAEADTRLARARERVPAAVERGFPRGRGHRPGHDERRRRGHEAPAPTPSASPAVDGASHA